MQLLEGCYHAGGSHCTGEVDSFSYLKDVTILEDRIALEKWIRLVAERLNVPVEPYLVEDDRAPKRLRGSEDQVRVIPDSLDSPYMHNNLLDIDALMNSQ